MTCARLLMTVHSDVDIRVQLFNDTLVPLLPTQAQTQAHTHAHHYGRFIYCTVNRGRRRRRQHRRRYRRTWCVIARAHSSCDTRARRRVRRETCWYGGGGARAVIGHPYCRRVRAMGAVPVSERRVYSHQIPVRWLARLHRRL